MCSDSWSYIILGVPVREFWGEMNIYISGFWVEWLALIQSVNPWIEQKDQTPPSKREFSRRLLSALALPGSTADCLWTGAEMLVCLGLSLPTFRLELQYWLSVSRLWVFSLKPRPGSPACPPLQILDLPDSIVSFLYIHILLLLFLWKTLTNIAKLFYFHVCLIMVFWVEQIKTIFF